MITTIQSVQRIVQHPHSMRVIGVNFKYAIRTVKSKFAGESFLLLRLQDVNGEELYMDVFSNQEGSFE